MVTQPKRQDEAGERNTNNKLLITLIFNRAENRSRLTVMDLDQDGPVPAQEVVQALLSAADELKFQMRLAQEQQAQALAGAPPDPATDRQGGHQ